MPFGQQPVLVQPAQVPVPAILPDGSRGMVPAGQLFPTQTSPFWEDQNTFAANASPSDGVFDPTLVGSVSEFLANQYRLMYGAQYGMLSFGTAAPTAHFELYFQRWFQDPAPPFNCVHWHPENVYVYTQCWNGRRWVAFDSASPPVIVPYTFYQHQPGCAPGYFAGQNFVTTAPVYNYDFDPQCGGAALSSGVILRSGTWSGPNATGDYTPEVPIPQPPAVTLKGGIDYPVAPQPCPPPVLVGGAFAIAPAGTAGSIVFVPGLNGTQIANVTLPDCQCTDGKTPVFFIQSVTWNPQLPLSVTLVPLSPTNYGFNFNMPPAMLPLVELALQIPLWDVATQQDLLQNVSIWCQQDGVNDQSGAFGLIIEQLLELRGKIDPQTQVPITTVTSVLP